MDKTISKNKQASFESRAQPPSLRKPWPHMSSHRDREALDKINLRRICKRVKNVFTRRSVRASTEPRELSRRTRLLRPLKRILKNATSKDPGEQSFTKGRVRNGHDPSSYMPITSSLTESPSPLATLPGPLSTLNSSRELSLTRSALLRVNLVKSGLPRTALSPSTNAANLNTTRHSYHSVPIRPSSNISFTDFDKTNSLHRHRVSQALILIGNSSNETKSKRNGLVLLPGRSATRNEFNPADSASESSSRALPPWDCDQADYQRLMRAFFRAPPSRIPIPVAWRNTAPRAYSLRGPTSPFQMMTTAPAMSGKENTKPMTPMYATEPRRARSSRIFCRSPATTAATKHNAASYSTYSTHSEAVVTDELTRHPSGDEHVVALVQARPSTPVRSRRLRYVKTLPLGWSLRMKSSEQLLAKTHTNTAKSATTMSNEDVWFDASEDTVDDEDTDCIRASLTED